jgi:hypothetical protein
MNTCCPKGMIAGCYGACTNIDTGGELFQMRSSLFQT